MPILPILMSMTFFCVLLIGLVTNLWIISIIGIIGTIYPLLWTRSNSSWSQRTVNKNINR